MELIAAMLAAALGGGTISALVNAWANRRPRERELEIKREETTIAGLVQLIGQLQADREQWRQDEILCHQELEALRLRNRELEARTQTGSFP